MHKVGYHYRRWSGYTSLAVNQDIPNFTYIVDEGYALLKVLLNELVFIIIQLDVLMTHNLSVFHVKFKLDVVAQLYDR